MRYRGICKKCKRVREKKWFEKNPDRMRVYYDTRNEKARTNPEIRRKLTELNRQWRDNNRDRVEQMREKDIGIILMKQVLYIENKKRM